MTTRRRLDLEMVRRGLVATREQAQAQVDACQVLVGGAVATKPARLVGPDEPIIIQGPPQKFVSRGGYKLEAALDTFSIEVAGRRCLDAGASTGGFTDCLLQRGASQVLAVDVGYGQLHERLRGDERVINLERTNIRTLSLETIGVPCSLVVGDLSFISLRLTVGPMLGFLDDSSESELVLLVKPQFEAGRKEVSRAKGVVRDPSVWRQVLNEISGAVSRLGAVMMGAMVSPITGSDGNVEFLMHLRPESAVTKERLTDPDYLFDQMIAEAADRHGR